MTRARNDKVTQAEIDRVVGVLRTLGIKPRMVELAPGRVRFHMEDGQPTSENTEVVLDIELCEYRKKNGYG